MTGKGSMLKSENTEIPAYEIEQPDLNFTIGGVYFFLAQANRPKLRPTKNDNR